MSRFIKTHDLQLDAKKATKLIKEFYALPDELPLNRRYHKEIHDIGNAAFCKKYHIEPVKLDKELYGIYKLRSAS